MSKTMILTAVLMAAKAINGNKEGSQSKLKGTGLKRKKPTVSKLKGTGLKRKKPMVSRGIRQSSSKAQETIVKCDIIDLPLEYMDKNEQLVIKGEDAPPICVQWPTNPKWWLVGVADGMGGRGASLLKDGKKEAYWASRVALDTLKKDFLSWTGGDLDLWAKQVNNKIYQELASYHQRNKRKTLMKGTLSKGAMPTTIAFALIRDNVVWSCHCGDSKVIVVYEDGSTVQTRDHSDKDRGSLTRYVSADNPCNIEIRKYNPGEKKVRAVIVLSDGLENSIYDTPGRSYSKSRLCFQEAVQALSDGDFDITKWYENQTDDISIVVWRP